MARKIWQVEDVKNHLLAVQVSVQAKVPELFIQEDDALFDAYLKGSDMALEYLARRFGVNLVESHANPRTQSYDRLKIWTREDIKRNLKVAWKLMLSNVAEKVKDLHSKARCLGIRTALMAIATSFDIEDALPFDNDCFMAEGVPEPTAI